MSHEEEDHVRDLRARLGAATDQVNAAITDPDIMLQAEIVQSQAMVYASMLVDRGLPKGQAYGCTVQLVLGTLLQEVNDA